MEEESARLRTSTAPDPAPTLRQVDGVNSFNQPLNKWNVSNVTNMEDMFNGEAAATEAADETPETAAAPPGSLRRAKSLRRERSSRKF